MPPFQSNWLMMSDVCKHCSPAPCLKACPTGAIFRTEFDTVVVQQDICNGCGYCVPACPFGVVDVRALDDRPDKIYHDLAEVVRCLVQLRTELTAGRREGEPGDRLYRCNAVLSMVIGGEYPLAGNRRDRVQKARDQLALPRRSIIQLR